ncbi:P-loop containing nucleoside triphosphate hydrolase protein [Atractiella rhizophila]|nr:P-loop containing nucleoside triphosphate hydrolase protein [Atractiella rhizophila]
MQVIGAVEFDNVSFSYDGKRTTLNNLSFKIPAGSSVALVGESGAGKSTILRLLYRFYDVTDGSIKIDGHDLHSLTQHSLRSQVGVVPQDSMVFNETVRYNIRYGNPTADEDRIISAAKAAQIHDRVLSFSDGHSTIVGDGASDSQAARNNE